MDTTLVPVLPLLSKIVIKIIKPVFPVTARYLYKHKATHTYLYAYMCVYMYLCVYIIFYFICGKCS